MSKIAEEVVKLKSMILKERRLRKEDNVLLMKRIEYLEWSLKRAEQKIVQLYKHLKFDGRD